MLVLKIASGGILRIRHISQALALEVTGGTRRCDCALALTVDCLPALLSTTIDESYIESSSGPCMLPISLNEHQQPRRWLTGMTPLLYYETIVRFRSESSR